MARTRYSGRRRKTFKRRFPKSRIMKRRRKTYNQYDKGYAEKIIKIVPLTANTTAPNRAANRQYHSIAWYPFPTAAAVTDPNLGSAPNIGGA